MKTALKNRFGLKETVQPLSTELHARTQGPGESLADFSSALIRLYDRMEAAATQEERTALGNFRDNTLKERFVTGVRDRQVQRELRRTMFASESMTFVEMRREVLRMFQDDDTMSAPKASIR